MASAAARFSAFISYSHADAGFVRRLHGSLESYRLPRRLRRRGKERGRLAPLFMDRAELAAAPNLTDAVRDAIEGSEHLIVVCSPSAAVSDWVSREIRLFRELHPDRTVLAALCRGDVDAAFHEELLVVGADGKREKPIAADFRKRGDGYRLALLKLVAPLADVGLDELVERDAQREHRRAIAVATASACGLVFAGGLGVLLFNAQVNARQERDRGDSMITHMLGDERQGLKQVGRLDLLDNLNTDALAYFKGRGEGQLSDDELARRAELLRDMTEDDIARGDFASGEAKAREALSTTAALLKARPNDSARVYDHAQSEFWFGFVRRREGDEAGVTAAFRAYADLAERLTRLKPGDPDARLERAYADSDLAVLLLQRDRDTSRAGALFTAAQADFEAVARLRPTDRDLQIQVLDGYAWLADVSRLQGDYYNALKYRLRQRSMIDDLLARDHRGFPVRSRLVSNELGVGRVQIAKGDWRGALATLDRAHADALSLADTDPQNMDVAQQVRAIELFEARAMLSAPRQLRPAQITIDRLLGDCSADAKRPNHDEIATYCTLLRARLLVEDGSSPAALALVSSLKSIRNSHSDQLSERWLIDWSAEMAAQS